MPLHSSLPDCRNNSLERVVNPNAHHSYNAAHCVTTVGFFLNLQAACIVKYQSNQDRRVSELHPDMAF